MQKILIVEDVEPNRALIVQLLEDTYEVLTATDGAEGLQLAAHAHPDLILMALANGWEVTQCLKADAALHDIPIIALSAHAMKGDREKALQSSSAFVSVALDPR